MTRPESDCQPRSAEPRRRKSPLDTGGASWGSKADIAAMCGVSQRTVHRWMKARKIPYIRIGNVYRFNRADVDAALRKFEHKPVV